MSKGGSANRKRTGIEVYRRIGACNALISGSSNWLIYPLDKIVLVCGVVVGVLVLITAVQKAGTEAEAWRSRKGIRSGKRLKKVMTVAVYVMHLHSWVMDPLLAYLVHEQVYEAVLKVATKGQ